MKRDLYTEVSERILAELQRGALPRVKPWAVTAGQNVPQNAVTNRPYSGCNVILLWLARNRGWSTPRFLTFKQAIEAGGNVRKGEHGTKVYFVKQLQMKDDDETDSEIVGERSEAQLIRSFCDKIAELTPQLVTFNGNSFDLPVLRYRAMIHGVPAPGLAARPYFNRYTEDAVDLCDILSSFAPHTKASLDELSKIMGMPGKPEGMDGNEVERYFLEGRIQQIAAYCETDVVNTYRVWLRYELFRGRLSESEHQASEANLIEFVKARGNTKPHLAGLM